MKTLERRVPDYLGGRDGVCPEMVQSQKNLVTEANVDLDHSKCFSMWSVQQGEKANTDGWYFVLPHLTCEYYRKQYHGIAIKLEHGVGIEWDGRKA
jgi:hypothetical protein